MARTQGFFKYRSESNRIKSEIATSYIVPWARTIGGVVPEFFFLDLFCGRGKFKDGAPSTPLLILDEIADKPEILNRLRMVHYDSNTSFCTSLKRLMKEHNTFSLLKYEPVVKRETIDVEFLASIRQTMREGTYSFVDPFGYSDISLDLIEFMSSKWGCDCLFYLSISGLVRNIEIEEKWTKIRSFLGDDGFEVVMEQLEKKSSDDKISEILLKVIEKRLRKTSSHYFVKLCFEFEKNRAESHYLVFISKHHIGFKIMRDIMIKRSDKDAAGFPLYRFSPTAKRVDNLQRNLRLNVNTKLKIQLAERLLKEFAGKTVILDELLTDCLKRGYLYQDSHIRKSLDYLRQDKKLDILNDETRSLDKRLIKTDRIRFH